MPDHENPAEEEHSLEAADQSSELEKYFADNEDKPSARIYRNLANDPMILEAGRRKKPSYRELLFLASGVVAALDEQIQDREAREQRYRRLDIPLITAPRSEDRSPVPGATPSPNKNEAHWILSYLTLRNVLGVLVVVVTLGSGFFAWWNKDYRSLVAGAEKRSEQLSEQVLELKEQLRTAETSLSTQMADGKRLEGLLGAADDEARDLKQRIATLEEQRDTQASQSTAQTVDLAKELGEAKAHAASLASQLTSANADVERWRDLAKDHERTVETRSTQLGEAEADASEATTQKDKAVIAWNQLIYFLGQHETGGFRSKVEVPTKKVKEQLAELKQYTSEVKGMRRELL